MGEQSTSGSPYHKDIVNSANQAFASFLANAYELVVIRDMAPILLEIIVDIASGSLLPQLIGSLMEFVSANTKGFDKNKLRPLLQHLETRKTVVRQSIKESITEKTNHNPQIIIHKRAIDRVTLTAAVSSFETYLTDTFKAIINYLPQKVSLFDPRGKAAEAYSRADYESLEEAVIRIHHREINFQDMEKTEAAYQKIGIQLFPESDQKARLKILFAKRHLIVHRGGKINQEYLKNVGENGGKLGSHIVLSEKYIKDAMGYIWSVVLQSEAQIVRTHLLSGEKVIDSVGEEIVQKMSGTFMS
jgi:hypothetical protein